MHVTQATAVAQAFLQANDPAAFREYLQTLSPADRAPLIVEMGRLASRTTGPITAEAAHVIDNAQPADVKPLEDGEKTAIKAFFTMLKTCKDATGKELSVKELHEATVSFLSEGLGKRAIHEVAHELEQAIAKDWVLRISFTAARMFAKSDFVKDLVVKQLGATPGSETTVDLALGALNSFADRGLPGMAHFIRQNIEQIQLLDEKQLGALKTVFEKGGLLNEKIEKVQWLASIARFLGTLGESAVEGKLQLKTDFGKMLGKRVLAALGFVWNGLVDAYEKIRIAFERRRTAGSQETSDYRAAEPATAAQDPATDPAAVAETVRASGARVSGTHEVVEPHAEREPEGELVGAK